MILAHPKLDTLPEEQKILFPRLSEIPKILVLSGGPAVALRYGHRESVDFDFFTSKQDIDILDIGCSLPFISEHINNDTASYIQHDINHVDFNIYVNERMVKVSLINNKELVSGAVNKPDIVLTNKINIASPLDIMSAKILALHNRTTAKDYFDLAELIKRGNKLDKGYEAAIAISKLSSYGTSRLMLYNLTNEFQSDTPVKVMKESTVVQIRDKADEYGKILKDASQKINLSRVEKTKMRADIDIINVRSMDRGR